MLLSIGMADSKKTTSIYIRNFVFGVEDSLVSTVGFLAGIAAADTTKSYIFISGLILISVEAFSMGVGSFLAEQSTQEFISHKDKFDKGTLGGAIIMFFSYFVSGFIPLAPYIVLGTQIALWTSIGLTLTTLGLLGGLGAKHFGHKDYMKHAIQTLIIGGLAAGAGVLVGKLANKL